jgi:hypothetical protein
MMTRGGQTINPLSIKSEPALPLDARLKSEFLDHILDLQQNLSGEVQSAAR